VVAGESHNKVQVYGIGGLRLIELELPDLITEWCAAQLEGAQSVLAVALRNGTIVVFRVPGLQALADVKCQGTITGITFCAQVMAFVVVTDAGDVLRIGIYSEKGQLSGRANW
jgi:hypothetical protein